MSDSWADINTRLQAVPIVSILNIVIPPPETLPQLSSSKFEQSIHNQDGSPRP
jgi:hypothetical protein